MLASVAQACKQRAADLWSLVVRALCPPRVDVLALEPSLPGP